MVGIGNNHVVFGFTNGIVVTIDNGDDPNNKNNSSAYMVKEIYNQYGETVDVIPYTWNTGNDKLWGLTAEDVAVILYKAKNDMFNFSKPIFTETEDNVTITTSDKLSDLS